MASRGKPARTSAPSVPVPSVVATVEEKSGSFLNNISSQTVHITCEVLAFAVMAIVFSKRNSHLQQEVDILKQKLTHLELAHNKLVQNLQQLFPAPQPQPPQSQLPENPPEEPVPEPVKEKKKKSKKESKKVKFNDKEDVKLDEPELSS